jgi:hypothetical protein
MNARRYLELLTLSALFLAPGIALAQTPDCKTLHWVTQDGKQVNAAHVFCGEINKKGSPTGFHSMALYASASKNKIRSVKKSSDLGNGLYDAVVTFTNGSQKSSTFYPDACSYEQILKSIAYAAAHPTGNARRWGKLGPSAPTLGDASYCLGTNGQPFTIRMNDTTQVNTAFPQP